MAKKTDKAKKTEVAGGVDIVIDLLERHSEVPSAQDLLSRFSRMYAGKPAGMAVPVVPAMPPPVAEPVRPAVVEPVEELVETAVFEALPEVPVDEMPVFEVPVEEYASLEDVASQGDDEGVTCAEPAVLGDEPGATVSMDAFEESAIAGSEDDDLLEEDLPRDPNATIVMGAIDESSVEIESSTEDDESRKKRKKRRHR